MKWLRYGVLAAAVICPMSTPMRLSAEGWELVFVDEFNGTALDREKWATRYIYEDEKLASLNDEAELYADNGNHLIAGGRLELIARPKAGLGGRFKFESGMIRSRQTFYYGYFETRVFFPSAKGSFPAFWLNSDYDRDGRLIWPPEIDVFEYVLDGWKQRPEMLNSAVMVNAFTPKGQGRWIYSHPKFNRQFAFFTADKSMSQGWHIIGLLWKPDQVTMYLDGTKLWTRAYRWIGNDGKLAGPAHVLLNMAVGGSWAGANGIASDQFPQKLLIDYVRICQFTTGTGGSEHCGGSNLTPGVAEGRYSAPFRDLPRSRLLSARLSEKSIARGGRIPVQMTIDTVATGNDHNLRFVLVDDAGKWSPAISGQHVLTSRWNGRRLIRTSFALPTGIEPGRYKVLASIGSIDPKNKQWWAVPIDAAPPFGPRDGFRQLTLGYVNVKIK